MHHLIAVPCYSVPQVPFEGGGGVLSAKDCGTRSLGMCTRPSGDADGSHCWARSAHGPHVLSHSCKKVGRQAA